MPDTSADAPHLPTQTPTALPARPSFCVFSVPVTAARETDPQYLALLAVRDRNGNVIVPYSAASWSRHLARSRAQPTVARALSVIGRFYEYIERTWEGGELDAEALSSLVFSFVGFRAGEIEPGDPDAEIITEWRTVTREVAWAEFKILAAFFARSGAADIQVELLGDAKPNAVVHHAAASRRDFYAHLAPQRERWRRLAADPDRPRTAGPPIRPLPLVRPVGSQDLMETEEVTALWRTEPDPVLRALWALLAGGGCRVSEALNIWAVDVMPGTFGKRFTEVDQGDLPFVVLADPIQSTFVGASGRNVTRIAYMRDRWNLQPRPVLPKADPLRAGWKGMTTTDTARALSWIYWIDAEAAAAFAEASVEIRAIHRAHGTDGHPWFFVNSGRGRWRGEPLKYSNVQKAFMRGARRVGLDTTRPHRNIHGFRHYYIWVMREIMKLSPEIMQLMLHHRHIASQKKYSLKASDVYRALSEIYGGSRS